MCQVQKDRQRGSAEGRVSWLQPVPGIGRFRGAGVRGLEGLVSECLRASRALRFPLQFCGLAQHSVLVIRFSPIPSVTSY